VLKLQPADAPFRIAGYSLSGIIAYELAGLLAGEGYPVEWLGLIDTWAPEQALHDQTFSAFLGRARQRTWRSSLRSARNRLNGYRALVAAEITSRISGRPLHRWDELGSRRLLQSYTPTPLDLPLDIVVAEVSASRLDPTLGWSAVHKGDIRIIEVAGDHLSLMKGAEDGLSRAILDSISAATRDQAGSVG
jgi:thioesterase domain-containing protein